MWKSAAPTKCFGTVAKVPPPPTELYEDELDAIRNDPLSREGKAAKAKLVHILTSDGRSWRQLRKAMSDTSLFTNAGMAYALNNGIIEEMGVSIVRRESDAQNRIYPHDETDGQGASCAPLQSLKSTMSKRLSDSGNDEFMSNLRCILRYCKSAPLSVKSGTAKTSVPTGKGGQTSSPAQQSLRWDRRLSLSSVVPDGLQAPPTRRDSNLARNSNLHSQRLSSNESLRVVLDEALGSVDKSRTPANTNSSVVSQVRCSSTGDIEDPLLEGFPRPQSKVESTRTRRTRSHRDGNEVRKDLASARDVQTVTKNGMSPSLKGVDTSASRIVVPTNNGTSDISSLQVAYSKKITKKQSARGSDSTMGRRRTAARGA